MSVERLITERETADTKIIWHRTNSIEQFLEAINTPYVAGLEFDIVATRDNVPVVFHDKSITKEIVGGGLSYLVTPVYVSELSFEELRKIRPDINSLQEIFEAVDKKSFRSDFEFHLEIKPNNPHLTDAILKLLQEFPTIDRQTIPRSFQNEVLVDIKQKRPERPICLLLSDKSPIDKFKHFPSEATSLVKLPDNIEEIKSICGGFRPEYVSVDYKMLTKPFIDAMKKAEVQVGVYTLNDINGLKGLKVDRIVTDKPQEISKELTGKGRC